MFDIGMSEMVVILLVALVVIGPERLPKVARTMGLMWGRWRRYFHSIRADIERDLVIEEYRQLTERVQREAAEVKQGLAKSVASAQSALQNVDREVAAQVAAASSAIAEPPPAEAEKKSPAD